MQKAKLISRLTGTVLLSTLCATGPAMSQPYYGDAPYGMGMMGGYGMGPGMMGPGMMGPMMMGRGPIGPSMMGPGMMGPGMMGPGMMGPGMTGPGMMGFGMRQINLNLSANDVKSYFERWVAFSGNSHIKVGSVAETNADTVSVDIVTTDKDGLVQHFDVDRRTGMFRPG